MSDLAIRVDNLGKLYCIGQREPYQTLRDTLTDAMYAPFRALATVFSGHRSPVIGPPSSVVGLPSSVGIHPGFGRTIGGRRKSWKNLSALRSIRMFA